jgi:nucleoside-diphosphate-sugar epimerase
MRVLVTGATGGLGNLIVNNLLSRGIEVIATSRDAEKAKQCDFFSKVKYIPYDIHVRNNEDLYLYFGKPDKLIHLAWEKLNEYKNEAHTTVIFDDHKKFISELIDSGLKDVTVVGSCYEYGIQEGMLSEEMESKPTLPYPVGKNMLRKFIEEKKKTTDFSFKWVRVFYVFGEVKGRKNLFNLLSEAVKNKDKIFNMSGGEQIRDFLEPVEISDIITRISLQSEVEGIINCCSGKPVKLKDFVMDFLQRNGYSLNLNLGFYPYPDYEPMETWGSVEKLRKVLRRSL